MGKGKYTKEERWEIGRQLYYSEISRSDACVKYGLNVYTVRDYMRNYRDTNKLPPKIQPVPTVRKEKVPRIPSPKNYYSPKNYPTIAERRRADSVRFISHIEVTDELYTQLSEEYIELIQQAQRRRRAAFGIEEPTVTVRSDEAVEVSETAEIPETIDTAESVEPVEVSQTEIPDAETEALENEETTEKNL